jgi:CheY-like chemotaxis protein
LKFNQLWPEGSVVKRKPIILCIDDNPDWRVGLKILLGAEEYDVLLASCGTEGLELYASQPVDAVILDYEMPEIKGDRVAVQMKLAKPDVPIVLLSAHDWFPENVLQSVDAFVAKGESPATLLTTIHDLLTVRSPFFTRWFNNWKQHTALKGSKPSHEASR